MQKLIPIVLAALAMLCPRQSIAHPHPAVASDGGRSFTGRVERVIDGDTIIVGTNPADSNAVRRTCRVRLAEIDAPELKTPYGPRAKKALSDMVLGKVVVVTWKRRGRYRRIIGQVHLTPLWANHEMVRQGWARQFRQYSRSKDLAIAETVARRSVAGMWRGACEE